jgi:hypothetical protein
MARACSRRMLPAIAVLLPVFALFIGLTGGLPAAAQAPATLSEAQDVNGAPGVVAEIVQCKREGGVLSIRMRLRNTGDKQSSVLFRVKDDHFYISGGSKKYLVLRDSEKTPLATSDDSTAIAKGASYAWYAKYPAPPAEVKKVTFYTPFTAPFEDIPITD